jgi:hypothetical protein
MAARTIDSRRDRLTTIMVAPLMTCSARIPVYTLIIAAFIPNETVWGFASLQGLVMFGLYAAGIVSALTVSFVIRRVFWRGQVEPFMMELPAYKLPDVKSVLMNLWLRARIFLMRAGKIILPLMIARRRDGSADRIQSGRDDRAGARTDLCSDWIQLADGHRARAWHGSARGCRGCARHGLCCG